MRGTAPAEGELARSVANFPAAFDDALVGMCLTAPDGRLLRVNAVFAAMLGRTTEQLLHADFTTITHPDDIAPGRALVAQVFAGECTTFRQRKRYLHADGSLVHVELSSVLVRDGEGHPLHLATQTIDVTDRELAITTLANQQQMLRAVIANSQSVIYVKDLDGRYLLANELLQRALRRTEDQILGRTDEQLHAVVNPVWRINDLRAQQGEVRCDDLITRANGQVVVYESVRLPLRDRNGVVYATCGISIDVTERRQLTADKEAAAEAIAQAARAALQATEAKASFLATMSHEIRTPMNAVIGMSALLLDTRLDTEQAHFVDTIRTSGEALLAIINDVLDFSKIESGQLQLEDHPFELQGCLDQALAQVAGTARHLDLVAHVGADCPAAVRGDSHRLRQILVNLVGNAVKFTPTGDVLLSVTAKPAPDRPDASTEGAPVLLTFTVRDTGIGIPPDRMDRLFRSFSQVDASTTRLYGGTGLGLAISKSLVRAMGGDITVASQVGVGSAFTFTIPLPPCPPDTDGLGKAPETALDLTGRTVLLVDDNRTSRVVLGLQLREWGMVCTEYPDGRRALTALTSGAAFDVALIDQQMPDLDGIALARNIQRWYGQRSTATDSTRQPGPPALPMVLLTTLGTRLDDTDTTLFRALHTKPVRPAALRRTLHDLLADRPHAPDLTGVIPAARDPEPGSLPGAGLRVLVAEDNAVNQQVADLMLRKLGCRPDIVNDGRQAVAAVRDGYYDLVLMDVHMPVLDGLDATRQIRALPAPRQRVRVIAMTASTSLESRTSCEQAGMDGYLSKPVRLEDLAATLAAAASPSPPSTTTTTATTAGNATGRTPPPAARPGDSAGLAGVDRRLRAVLNGLDPEQFALVRQELLDGYLDQTHQLLCELPSHVRRGDTARVAELAHNLHGMSANIGADAIADLSRHLEATALSSETGQLPTIVQALEHAHRCLLDACAHVRAVGV